MNLPTRSKMSPQFLACLHMVVIVAMIGNLLLPLASHAAPPQQEPVEPPVAAESPTPVPTASPGDVTTLSDQTIYLPIIFKAEGNDEPPPSPPPPEGTEILVKPGVGGIILAADGRVRAAFSRASVQRDTWVRYETIARPLIITPGLAVGGPAFAITAWEAATNNPVTRFPHQVTLAAAAESQPVYSVITPSIVITVSYAEADVWGLDLRTLSLYTRQSSSHLWERLPTTVYQDQKLLVTEADHLSEFVVLGQLAYIVPQDIKRLVLDPDDDVGIVTWPDIGEVHEITYNVLLAQEVKQRFENDNCQADILLTRESASQTFVDRSIRAQMAINFGSNLFTTLAFNTKDGLPWGIISDGGVRGWARNGHPDDDALVNEFFNWVTQYTTRPHTLPVQHPPPYYPPYPEFEPLPGTYAHIETLFLDHNFDWPVVYTGFSSIADAAYAALRTRLEAMGMTCGNNALPLPPSAEQLQRWRDLGYQNLRTFGSQYRLLLNRQYYQLYGGDPVSFSTGNHIIQVALGQIPGRGGLDFDFTLTYNAQDGRNDLFGYGWSFPYNIRAQRYSDESVNIVLHDGRTFHYLFNGSGYETNAGVHETLTRTADGWTWTTLDGTILTFKETLGGLGILTEWHDRRGNKLQFSYDLNDPTSTRPPLLEMRDDAGRVVTFTNNEGHVTRITLPDGRFFSFGYTNDDLTSMTDANGGTRRFQYDARHRVTHEWDAENILFLQNIYDDRDRVTEQIDASQVHSYLSYDPISRTTTFTDNLQNVYRYSYDELNRVTAEEDAEHNITRYSYDAAYNLLKVTDARGAETNYAYDDRGNMTRRVEPVASCVVSDYAQDITTWEYNAQNDLVKTTNAPGHITTFDYDALGNLLAIHKPGGRNTSFIYNPWGQPTLMTDANGHPTFYEYDTYGNLIKTTDAEGNITTSTYDITGRELSYTDANGHIVTFTYDNNDNITRITDPKDKDTTFQYNLNNLLLQSKNRRGVVSDYQYDENLKLVAERDFSDGQWLRYEYDALYRRVGLIDRRGYATHYEYDEIGRLKTTTDPRGAVTRYEYDANNNLTALIEPLGQRTEMVYDAMNRLKTVIDAAGSRTDYCYDAEDRLIRVIEPRGGVTHYTYDEVDNLVEMVDPLGAVTLYKYDPVDNRTALIDGNNNHTDYIYDRVNRLRSVARPPVTGPELSSPQRPTTQFAYDGVGNTLVITSPRGFATHFTYDENDNLHTVTDPLGGRTSYTYDEEDNPVTTTDPNNQTTTISYNPVDLPSQVRDPLGHTTRLDYDAGYNLNRLTNALGRPSLYDYDPQGQVVRATDPLGNKTLYERDLQGRVTAMTDANNHTTRYSYDPMGRLAAVTDALSQLTHYEYDTVGNLVAMTDANHHTTRFSYDLRNQLTQEINPLEKTWGYDYDAVGSLVSRIDGNNQTTHYSYDSNNRLIALTYADATSVHFGYDLAGNQIEMCDWLAAEGTCARTTYDPLDRPIDSADWLGRTIKRSYDAAGNLTQLIYPNNQPVKYAYDARNQLVSLEDHFSQRSVYAYDPVGLLTQIARPNGTTTAYAYDEADRLTHLLHQHQGETFSAFAYALDKVGNRTQITELRTFPGDGALIPVTTVKQYRYDALNRLLDADTDQGQDMAYNFDPVGNRLKQAGIPQAIDPTDGVEPVRPGPPLANTYTYNEANQLTAISSPQALVALTYDSNGNRIHETETRQGQTLLTEYRYDFENRLVGVTKSVQETTQIKVTMVATYTYDGYGRRVKKQVSNLQPPISNLQSQKHASHAPLAQLITYVYNDLDPIADYETIGRVTTSTHYYWANGGIAEIEQLPNPKANFAGARYWTHTDGLGSLIDLTNDRGQPITQVYYDEYGQLLTKARSLTRYSYTGQEFDSETGLYHFYARYYDPVNGAWLGLDRYRGKTISPLSLHRYNYVTGNPINYIDHLGYQTSGCGVIRSCASPSISSLSANNVAKMGCGYTMSCQPPVTKVIESGNNGKSIERSGCGYNMSCPTQKLIGCGYSMSCQSNMSSYDMNVFLLTGTNVQSTNSTLKAILMAKASYPNLFSNIHITGVPPGSFEGLQIVNITQTNKYGYPYRYLAADFSHGNYFHLNTDVFASDPHLLRNLEISNDVLREAELPLVLKGGSKVVKGLNKVALPLAIAIDSYDLGSSAYKDYQTTGQLTFGNETKKAVGRVGGGWGGAAAGCGIGALATSWLGPGAGAGCLVGGIIGGIGGSYGGEKIAEEFIDKP